MADRCRTPVSTPPRRTPIVPMRGTSVERVETIVPMLGTSVGRVETIVPMLGTSVGRVETIVPTRGTSVERVETIVPYQLPVSTGSTGRSTLVVPHIAPVERSR